MDSRKMERIGVRVTKCSETSVLMERGHVVMARTWDLEDRGRGSCS